MQSKGIIADVRSLNRESFDALKTKKINASQYKRQIASIPQTANFVNDLSVLSVMQFVDFKNHICDIDFVSTKGDAMDKRALSKIMLIMVLFTTPILAENDQDLSQTEPSNQDNSTGSTDSSNEPDSAEQKEKDRRERVDLLGKSLMERGVY